MNINNSIKELNSIFGEPDPWLVVYAVRNEDGNFEYETPSFKSKIDAIKFINNYNKRLPKSSLNFEYAKLININEFMK